MAKVYSKRSTILLLLLAMFFAVLLPISANAAIKVTAPKQLFVDIGGTAQINVVTAPAADLTTLGLTYKSANKQIATVDSTGLVSGIAKGSTTITVQYGKKSLKVTALVSDKGVPYTDGATFSIEYPESWTVAENVLGVKVVFISPLMSSHDKFQESLSISQTDLSETATTLDQLVRDSIPLIKKLYSNVKILSNKKAYISGHNAQQIIYTFKQGAYSLKIQQIIIIFNNKAYSIAYGGEINSFDTQMIEFEKMVKSFKILG